MQHKLLALIVIVALGNISLAFSLPDRNKTDIKADEIQNAQLSPNNIIKLGEIEQYLFGKIFSSKNFDNRLSRVEKRLFYTTYTNLTNTQRPEQKAIVSSYQYLFTSTHASLGQKSSFFSLQRASNADLGSSDLHMPTALFPFLKVMTVAS